MTNEEAIGIIEVAKAECEWNAPIDYYIAFDMAIRALRKQIPRKCVKKDGYFVCSICRKLVVYDDAYCCNCGKAIDWSEYE